MNPRKLVVTSNGDTSKIFEELGKLPAQEREELKAKQVYVIVCDLTKDISFYLSRELNNATKLGYTNILVLNNTQEAQSKGKSTPDDMDKIVNNFKSQGDNNKLNVQVSGWTHRYGIPYETILGMDSKRPEVETKKVADTNKLTSILGFLGIGKSKTFSQSDTADKKPEPRRNSK